MNTVQDRLRNEAYRFNFFQAIHLLEIIYRERPPIGHLGPFNQEVVKILPNHELSFAPADVSKAEVQKNEEGSDNWIIYENFLGLYGPNAATPMYIAEMISQCPRDNDALRDFFDIFNHRILSLYYRAWKKHNLCASISPTGDDAFSKILCSMIGQDPEAQASDWRVGPERLLRYSSYFSSASRPAYALENLISDFFQIEKVDVVQFVPRRYTPHRSALGKLSVSEEGGRLGESIVLGDTITDVSGQFKIRLGGLSITQFMSFQPGEPRYEELIFLTNMYVKHQLGFSVELVLKPCEGGGVRLSSGVPIGSLGRSAWLGSPSEKETTVIFEVHYDS